MGSLSSQLPGAQHTIEGDPFSWKHPLLTAQLSHSFNTSLPGCLPSLAFATPPHVYLERSLLFGFMPYFIPWEFGMVLESLGIFSTAKLKKSPLLDSHCVRRGCRPFPHPSLEVGWKAGREPAYISIRFPALLQ